jgi:iron complex transport system ATP-binding protein
MAAVECRGLACGYGSKKVLSDLSFDLEAGSVTALLGPNGCGKSTLLKTVTGELKPLAGSLWLNGANSSDLTPLEVAQRVAFVPPEEQIEFPFTVREIVSMGRLPRSPGFFDTEEDRIATGEAIRDSECEELADRAITELSAGERQRVLIARALAQTPGILLLDEPTSHLDPGHQVSFVSLVRRLAGKGITILAALHDLNLAAELADSAFVFSNGTMTRSGKIEQVLRSHELERAYGVAFDKTTGAGGKTRLHPLF